MKRRYISCMLIFVLVMGLFTSFGEITYAANQKFSFTWEQNQSISKIINIPNRIETDNELVLKWSYNTLIGGTDKYTGEYLLKYHLDDNQEIELKVNNEVEDTAKISYAIKNLDGTNTYKPASIRAFDATTSKVYWIYDSTTERWHNETNSSILWQNGAGSAQPDKIFAPAGVTIEKKQENANITLKKGSSVAFKYDNKLVVLQFDISGGNIALGIEGIQTNRIYDFNISCNNGVNSQGMDIFKLAEFRANPIGERFLSKLQDPNIYAGTNPGMEVVVTIPSSWDETVNKYVYNPYSDGNNYEGLNAVINLKPSQTDESIQINIPDIYSNSNPTISPTSSTKAQISGGTINTDPSTGKKYYSFKLTNLESSRLYTTANITFGTNKKRPDVTETSKFLTRTCNLPSGETAYTYLEYDAKTHSSGGRVLEIKPYNVSGTYYIYKAATVDAIKSDGSLISTQVYKVSTGSGTILIPIDTQGEFIYMVEFVHELGTVVSQMLQDSPKDASYLITPKMEIKDYKVITENIIMGEENIKQQKLQMVLSWTGGISSVFDSLVANGRKVVYSFEKTPFGPREEDKYKEFFKLRVTKGSDYVLSKEPSDTGDMWDTAKILDTALGHKTGVTTRVVASTSQGEQKEIVFTLALEFDIVNEENLADRDEPSKIFYYPSVYYLKMRGAYTTPLGTPGTTNFCNPLNITLNTNSNVVLPPPQDITADTVTMKSFDLKWSTVGDTVYKQYLEINNYTLDEKGAKVNIFLTQKSDLEILNGTDKTKKEEFIKNYVVNVPFSSVFSSLENGKTTLNLASVIDIIRANKVLCITDVPQAMDLKTQIVTLSGLDKNTVYYSALQTVLDVTSNSDGSKHKVVSDSISQIVTITTKKEDPLNPPQPGEIFPPAPVDFKEDAEVERKSTKVGLTWTDVKDPQSIDGIDTIKEYEIIRVDKKLDDTVLNKRDNFDDFWKNNLSSLTDTQKLAWQTASSSIKPDNLLMYNNSDFVLDSSKTTGKYTYETSKLPKLGFVDETLMPNKIYYYYIRTVRMVKGENGTYSEAAWSSWVPLSITTSPVKSPTDLKVERNETYFTYDKKTEVVVSFFAAIPVGTSVADIAKLYPLEYSIMMDGGEWKTYSMDVTNSSLFKSGNEKKDGYQQFVYKITGLEPGKGYSIKVRMKSRVNDLSESNPVYDVSLDSNTVQHRTDTDQGITDEEDNMNKWLKLYDDEVLKLSTKTYWVTANSSTSYEAIYRTLTFGGELQKATSGAYEFEATGQEKQVYYIPAASITKSDDAQIGFRAVKDGVDVLIRPDSFDKDMNEAIKDVLSDIHDGDIKDYYIKLEFNWLDTKEKINNSDPLSKEISVDLSIVGSKQPEKTLDAQFVKMFNDAIDGTIVQMAVREQLKKDLKIELKRNATNEELYKLVMDAVGEVYDRLIGDIEREFDRNIRNSYVIYSLEQNILITAPIDNQSSVVAYRKNNTTWETINVSDYGGKKGFETKLPGVFIFAGKVVNIPNIEGITNSTSVKELIAKYGLDDYLGKDIIDVNAYATKYMVVGSIARMAGASNTQNEVSYLKSKGINVTSGKLYNNISNQETLYLIMSLYEIKTGTKVSTIRITNYNAIPDLTNVNNNYKNNIKGAVQLGIYNDNSIGLNDDITIRTLLDYLGNISTKI